MAKDLHNIYSECNFPARLRGNTPPPEPPFDIETFEPIEPPWQAIRTWIPADDNESPTAPPVLWDQTTGTGWKAPEIDPGGTAQPRERPATSEA